MLRDVPMNEVNLGRRPKPSAVADMKESGANVSQQPHAVKSPGKCLSSGLLYDGTVGE